MTLAPAATLILGARPSGVMGLFGAKESMELTVSGMTCGNCVQHVSKALSGVAGVKKVDVDLEGSATVHGKGLDRAALVAAVQAAGYEAE